MCVGKLGESRTAAVIMVELKEIFAEKYINKSLICLSTWKVQMR